MQYELIRIRTCATEDEGLLSFFEGGGHDLPFDIKRIYYIHGVPANNHRGGHSHKELRQLLFCPYGKILIHLEDGKTQEDVLLDSPDKGLLLEPGLWRDMYWQQDNSVLCVAADRYYDESDYIRDHDAFLAWCAAQP